jgi:hypothetical protein
MTSAAERNFMRWLRTEADTELSLFVPFFTIIEVRGKMSRAEGYGSTRAEDGTTKRASCQPEGGRDENQEKDARAKERCQPEGWRYIRQPFTAEIGESVEIGVGLLIF